MEISVVIPAFNEEKVILQTLTEVKFFLLKNYQSFEIIVVDDKSTDRTLDLLENFSEIKLLKNQKNHGKGYSVAKGVKAAKGEWILFMDADNSTKIKELNNFKPDLEENDLLIASRAVAGAKIIDSQAKWKVIFGRLGNKLIQILLLPGIQDTQCGFKLFRSELKGIFEQLTIEDWGFDFELLFLARKKNFKIKELPVEWLNNQDSKVKFSTYFKTILQVLKVRVNYFLNKYQI
ncbi:glycosyltransferase family 2 protein [Candidatus Nomurabacteria bacterium]|nr:glycosyltransferase family 2 protein [Candidatus Nomurabacteria bacterium]